MELGGTANRCFQSFLDVWKQFTSIQGCHSAEQLAKYGVTQSLVLGPLLFIVLINDFRKAVEFSSVHHFANDTNLLLLNKLLKNINNHINRDLKLTINRVTANKLSPNTIKTEIVILKPGNSEPPNILTFTLAAKKLNHSEDEALRLINFQPLNAPAGSLYQKTIS